MLYVMAVCEQHEQSDVIGKKTDLVKHYINAGQGREKGLLFLLGDLFFISNTRIIHPILTG